MLIVPVDVHEKALEGLHPYVRAVTEAVGGIQDIFGNQCYVGGELEGKDAGALEYINIEYDGEPMVRIKKHNGKVYVVGAYDAWNELYQGALPKDSYFSWSIDG